MKTNGWRSPEHWSRDLALPNASGPETVRAAMEQVIERCAEFLEISGTEDPKSAWFLGLMARRFRNINLDTGEVKQTWTGV